MAATGCHPGKWAGDPRPMKACQNRTSSTRVSITKATAWPRLHRAQDVRNMLLYLREIMLNSAGNAAGFCESSTHKVSRSCSTSIASSMPARPAMVLSSSPMAIHSTNQVRTPISFRHMPAADGVVYWAAICQRLPYHNEAQAERLALQCRGAASSTLLASP
eukprot:scaffold2984_cov452-Prasinococcus_capsulatus_cf.AAC.8